MRHIKLFESFEDNFVGIHCSAKSLDHDQFYGKIIDEYYMAFPQILNVIQDDYEGAREYLEQIDSLEDGLSMDNDSVDLIYEIEEFFSDNHLEWIFVSEGEALTKYGENCYNVYFKDISRVYSMADELTDNARIYIYDSRTDAPILKRVDDI